MIEQLSILAGYGFGLGVMIGCAAFTTYATFRVLKWLTFDAIKEAKKKRALKL